MNLNFSKYIKPIIIHQTSLKGWRQSNQDYETYTLNLGKITSKIIPKADFFVICDGHGNSGDKISKVVALLLKKNLMSDKLNYPLNYRYIIQIYNEIQAKLQLTNITGGTTALVLIRYQDIHKNENIQILNTGDSRAVMSINGNAIQLTVDHKPNEINEYNRITKISKKYPSGIKIYQEKPWNIWRIGYLSVSRSFGDFDHVPYITHLPQIHNYKLNNDVEFIIMACDGLWDVVSNQEAVNFVIEHIQNNNYKYAYHESVSNDNQNNIAYLLAQYAISKGSTDNVSIFIIFLKF